MKNDDRKIGEIIDNAKTYIVVTNESAVAKGRKAELMALIGTLLDSFFREKIIDEEDLEFIIKTFKENVKKENKESIESILDKTIEDMFKKLFNFENKD